MRNRNSAGELILRHGCRIFVRFSPPGCGAPASVRPRDRFPARRAGGSRFAGFTDYERGQDHNTGCPGAQPEERRRGDSARQARRGDGAVRLGQVVARVRHDLRRGAAPLHGDPFGLCAAVRRHDGAARRGQDHGAQPGGRHRTEDHQQEPPFDGGNRDRDQRLPASALRPRLARLFARDGRGDGPLYRRADRRTDRRGVRRPQDRADGPRGQGPQGPLPRTVRIAGQKGLSLCAHRRRDPRNIRRHASRPLQGPHDRAGGRPAAGDARCGRSGDDLAARGAPPGKGDDGRLRLRLVGHALLFAALDVSVDGRGVRGSGAPHLLVQFAPGGLPPLQRTGRGDGLRPEEDRSRHEPLAARGGRRTAGQIPQQHALRHARDAGAALRLHAGRPRGDLLRKGA